jgi:dTMP kinase
VLRAGNTGGTTIDSETRETGPVDLSGVAALRYVLRVRGFRRLWMVLSEEGVIPEGIVMRPA